jgi:hypothetical protein
MKRKTKERQTRLKTKLGLPDLEHAKVAVIVSLRSFGSAQEFDGACILSRFLKNDKFCFCDRHALRLEQ